MEFTSRSERNLFSLCAEFRDFARVANGEKSRRDRILINPQKVDTRRNYLQDDRSRTGLPFARQEKPYREEAKAMSELNRQIRVVKRNELNSKVQAEIKPRPIEQSATVIVKSWIADLKERKRNERQSFALVFGVSGNV